MTMRSSVMEKFPIPKIDLNVALFELEPQVIEREWSPATTALTLGGVAIEFARVERVPRYDKESRENDAEHSYMLALVASELATSFYSDRLNAGLVSQFAIVHDLIELVTGDKATFHYSAQDMADKEIDEHAVLEGLLERLPPHTRRLLDSYEQQSLPEARFVKAVDKLLPVVVDILGEGRKIMNEDYNVHTAEELLASHLKLYGRISEKFEQEFPDIVSALGMLYELFELEF
jgi:5'-deoxynucleotidase YfbR-like HD superfamily hydrolase